MPDDRDHRLESLELKLMEFEVTQGELDAVVIRQGLEIEQLKSALEIALARLEAAGKEAGADVASEDALIVHELPPHY